MARRFDTATPKKMTLRHPRTPRLIAFTLTLSFLASGCGSGDAPEGQQSDTTSAAAPAELEGSVLESPDYFGLEDGNITFHLHWVGGPIAKDAPAGTAPVALEAVRTVPATNFDRVMFRFAGPTLPGYQVSWVATPETCGRQTAAPAGTKQLRVRLLPTNTSSSVKPEVAEGHGNLEGVTLTCAEDDRLDWHLGVADSASIRVLELGTPPRLVVDIRQGPSRPAGTAPLP
jgi:hypothetical protein